MQDRPKNSATIARLINRDDIPNIQYSLRKLESAGLVTKSRDEKSKQFNYVVTDRGTRVTDEYHDIKGEILIERLKQIQNIESRLEDLAQLLSILTGVYEESARDSATFTPMSDSDQEP
jgi:predicted MarR family transcription regulator